MSLYREAQEFKAQPEIPDPDHGELLYSEEWRSVHVSEAPLLSKMDRCCNYRVRICVCVCVGIVCVEFIYNHD